MTRVSTIEGDEGFGQHCGRCRVFLAGSERKHVRVADEQKRFAQTFRTDENGKFVHDDVEVKVDDFHGDVAIFCPCKGEVPPSERSDPVKPAPQRPLFG